MHGNKKELIDHGKKNQIDLNYCCCCFLFLCIRTKTRIDFHLSLRLVTTRRSFPSRSSRLAPPKTSENSKDVFANNNKPRIARNSRSGFSKTLPK